MVWIQYTLRLCKTPILLLLIIGFYTKALGQPNRVIINLPSPSASLLKSPSFFIQEVEDKRKTPGSKLGKIIQNGKEELVYLPNPVDQSLMKYWSAATRNKTGLPIYITIKELRINENKTGPNKITGEIGIHVSYKWYRHMQPVELTQFQTTANYTRPANEPIHEKIVEQILNQTLTHFDQWHSANKGKVPSLAQNLILVFKEVQNKSREDTVFYDPKRPLIWADFKGNNRKPGSLYAAMVFTSFAYEGRSYPKGQDLVVEIQLKVFMVKSMSWVRPESKTPSTLRHEQLHFDITRMVVERFKENLKKAELTIEDHDSEIQYQFLETFREMNREQENYDNQTHHGLQPANQAAWDAKISAEINQIYSTQ